MTQKKRGSRFAALALLSVTSAFFSSAYAAAVLQSVRGDVRAGTGSATPQPVSQNARVLSGMRVTTGAGAQAFLRFDDGQQVVLSENTDFFINDYRYSEGAPRNDRSVFDILRGALRVVTGLMGQRNAAAFQLRAPQMTIGIRGTDFMVAIVNPAYVSVLQGAIGVSNGAGPVTFGAGSIGSIATSNTLAVTIPAAALPPAASAAFSNLGAVAVTAGTTAGGLSAGAEPGTTAPASAGATATVGQAIAIGAAAAAIGAAVGNNPVGTTTHHGQ